MTKPVLYIMHGIPGSGKSTLAKKMILEGLALQYAEADRWAVDRNGNYFFNPEKAGYCHMRCRETIEGWMKEGLTVINSNPNLERSGMNTYFAMAEKYGYDVVVIRLHTSYGSIHCPKEKVINFMQAQKDCFNWRDLPQFVRILEHNE